MFGSAAKKENEDLRAHVAHLQSQLGQLQSRNGYLEQLFQSMGGGDIDKLDGIKRQITSEIESLRLQFQEASASFNAAEQQAQAHFADVQRRLSEVEAEKARVSAEVIETSAAVRLQSFGLFEFENPAADSVRLAGELEAVRGRVKEMVRLKKAVTASSNFTYNNSAAKGRSFANKLSKLALRSYNAEVENAITRMKAGNLEAGLKRLEKARSEVSRMGDMIDLRVTSEFHSLRIRELTLAAEHLEAKKAAKEAEREERQIIREEQKAQKDLEAARAKLTKEQSHYENAIANLMAQGRTDEIGDLEEKLNEIRRGIEDVDYRAANQRAGYVYVISNLGSFGERMVKIGMTRRLEPMDRVRELGDASVPFNFDVHTLHFSEDAVSVEAALHRKFADRKVNRINNRREFFYATPAEVREAFAEIDGTVLEYHENPDAEQYRLSQAMYEDPEGE